MKPAPSATRGPGPAASSNSSLVLALVASAQFMLLIDDTIVNVALPTIGATLDMAEGDLSWVVNAYFLTFGGFLLVGGRAADLLGRRRALVAALIGFSAASFLAGLANSGLILVLARGAQGLAAALLAPAALAILLATFPTGPQRTKALGIWVSLTGVGAATGLLAGGVIVETLDWRWVFFVNVPVGLIAAAVAPRLVPADRRPDRQVRPDLPGAVLSTAGLLLLVYTVVETNGHGWLSLRTLGALAAVAVLGVLFVLRERSTPAPLLPGALVCRRRVAMANVVTAIGSVGLFAMFFFLTLYMQDVQEWGALRTGVSYLPFTVTIVVTSGILTRLVHRLPARPLLVTGLVLTAIGMWLLRGLDAGDTYFTELMPILILTGFGLGLVFVPLLEAATSSVEDDDSGVASALVTTSQQVGAAVGIAVLVTIATHRTEQQLAAGYPAPHALVDGFDSAFTVAAGILAGAALLALAIGRNASGDERTPVGGERSAQRGEVCDATRS